MATPRRARTDSPDTTQFTLDPTDHLQPDDVDDGTPTHVLVQISGSVAGHVAFAAAGPAGRWSFDLSVSRADVDVTRTYESGTRVDGDDLPTWLAPVHEAIEQCILAGN